MYVDDFKARYKTIPFAIYRERCEYKAHTVIAHNHREMELIRMTKGHADFYIDTVHYEAKEGDVVVIPPYAIHRILLSADEVVVYDCICFDLELIWDADIKTGLINNTLSVKNLIDRENLCTENMQEWISVSCDACENGHPGWELEAIGCISMLIGCLKKHGYFTTELRGKKETEFIQKVMCYISDHYSSHITSSTAATALYMNNSYFCRAFKKAFDCRFSDYLQAYRLEKARICLSNTNDSITDIAFRSGFNGCSYFSQVFKEHFGISPVTYRKEWARRYSAERKRKW